MDDSPGGREEKGSSEDPQGEETGGIAGVCCSKVGQLLVGFPGNRREGLGASQLLGLSLPSAGTGR